MDIDTLLGRIIMKLQNIMFWKRNVVAYDYKLLGETYTLMFARKWMVPGSGGTDRANATYRLGGRTYTGLKTVYKAMVEELSEGCLIGMDAFGGKILYQYGAVPTFDFGDRKWDSVRGSFLISDGINIDLLRFNKGYCVGTIEVYERLLSADESIKLWLERLEFPVKKIRWNNDSDAL